MIVLPARRAACAAAACVALTVAGGCTDLPTGTDSFQLEADGRLWTAVIPPSDLPTANTWLAFGAAGAPETVAAAAAVDSLRAEADQARIDGDARRADALLAAAASRAVSVMEREPGPAPFLTGIASLEGWERRVRSSVDLSRAPGLEATLEAVASDREAVERAFLGGDPRTAAVLLTRASDRVREWAPQGIALQVLDRALASLENVGLNEVQSERVDHLVRSAREELVRGEPLRAVQRALYALQLARGNGLPEIPLDERARCGEFTC